MNNVLNKEASNMYIIYVENWNSLQIIPKDGE